MNSKTYINITYVLSNILKTQIGLNTSSDKLQQLFPNKSIEQLKAFLDD